MERKEKMKNRAEKPFYDKNSISGVFNIPHPAVDMVPSGVIRKKNV